MNDKAKVVVVGDAYGIDFHSKAVVTNSGEAVRLQLWDTAGQERFLALLPSYLRDCCVVLIVFDLTNRKSFEGIPLWVDYVKKNSLNRSQIVFVGTKNDLINEKIIEKTEIDILMKKYSIPYHEVSAVTADGIQNLFQNTAEIALEALKKKKDSVGGINIDDSGYTSFPEVNSQNKKSFLKKCCSG